MFRRNRACTAAGNIFINCANVHALCAIVLDAIIEMRNYEPQAEADNFAVIVSRLGPSRNFALLFCPELSNIYIFWRIGLRLRKMEIEVLLSAFKWQ